MATQLRLAIRPARRISIRPSLYVFVDPMPTVVVVVVVSSSLGRACLFERVFLKIKAMSSRLPWQRRDGLFIRDWYNSSISRNRSAEIPREKVDRKNLVLSSSYFATNDKTSRHARACFIKKKLGYRIYVRTCNSIYIILKTIFHPVDIVPNGKCWHTTPFQLQSRRSCVRVSRVSLQAKKNFLDPTVAISMCIVLRRIPGREKVEGIVGPVVKSASWIPRRIFHGRTKKRCVSQFSRTRSRGGRYLLEPAGF